MSLITRLRRRPAPPAVPDETDTPNDVTGAASDKPARVSTVGIIGSPYRNLLVNKHGTWAWFLAGDKTSWLCPTDEKRATAMSRLAHIEASLVNPHFRTRITWRLTGAPFDRGGWARRTDEERPAPDSDAALEPGARPRLPDPEEGQTFDEALTLIQERMGQLGSRVPAVAFGVLFSDRRMTENELVKMAQDEPLIEREGALEKDRLWLRRVTEVVAGQGLDARPLSAGELNWLIHASAAPGAPLPPMHLQASDPETFGRSTTSVASPLGAATQVTALRGGRAFTHHVQVLHLKRLASPRDAMDRGLFPLLAWAQTLPFPVDVMCAQEFIDTETMKRTAQREGVRARSIDRAHHKNETIPEAAVARAITRSEQVMDEVGTGDRVTSVRSQGPVLFMVWGDTEEEAASRGAALQALASEQQGATLSHEFGQLALARSFIPGSPLATKEGPQIRVSLDAFGSFVPHASLTAGDTHRGQYMGPIYGSGDLFLLDGFKGASMNMSQVMAFLGGMGGGKSHTVGSMLAWHARLGVRCVANDPSGMMERLTHVSYLRNDSRHIGLGSVKPGTLTPGFLVPEPSRGNYATHDDYTQAVADAQFRRVQLTEGALRGLLPYQLVTSAAVGERVVELLRDAVADVGGDYGLNPWDVVGRLQREGPVGQRIAKSLEASTKFRGGALIFPPRDGEAPERYMKALMEQATLTVVSMQGLPMPPEAGLERSAWTDEQLQAVPVMRLAAELSNMVVYSDQDEKFIANDEAGLIGGQGAAEWGPLLSRYLADSRKWNALIAIIGQNPNMLTAINEEVANQLGQIWAFRMSEDAAAKVLRMMGLPAGYGFESMIVDLLPGEALVRDWNKRFPVVQVDIDAMDPELVAALDTNPDKTARRREDRYVRRLGVGV